MRGLLKQFIDFNHKGKNTNKKKNLKGFEQINDMFIFIFKTVGYSKEKGLKGAKTRGHKRNRRLTAVQVKEQLWPELGTWQWGWKVVQVKNIYDVISLGLGD